MHVVTAGREGRARRTLVRVKYEVTSSPSLTYNRSGTASPLCALP
jgi:hypothetical protein